MHISESIFIYVVLMLRSFVIHSLVNSVLPGVSPCPFSEPKNDPAGWWKPPQQFVCHLCLSVRTTLCKFITIEHCILNRAVSLQILQGRNNRQPANDGANTTMSEDRVWRFQQTGFRAGEVEKGGDATENNLVVTLDNLGR